MKKNEKQNTRRGFMKAALAAGGAVMMKGSEAKAAGEGAVAARMERERRIKASPQWKDGRFHNALPTHEKTLQAIRKWIGGAANGEPVGPVPVMTRKASDFATPPESGLRITWLGHASVMVEIGGRRFLTDPVWGERTSPSRYIGPRRFFDPPLPLSELPQLDAVVLSHDHYDHLCSPTFEHLKTLDTRFIVPLGVGARLADFGVPEERIQEFDWWESVAIGDVTLTFTPARHFSGRSLFDRDKTLWGGWAFATTRNRAFFSGDGGYFPGFKEIGSRLGPFDVTFLEAGAYDEAWPDVHMGPEQALRAHADLGGKVLLPIHWGTFNLAIHAWTEPGERMLAGARLAGIKLALPRPGESFEPAQAMLREPEKWWPEVPWKTASENPIISTGV